jgi:hypothetical protein
MTARACLRTLVVSAAVGLAAVGASAQTANPFGHAPGGPPHAVPAVDLPSRLALLDERIGMLTEDMKIATGDLKILTMAQLIEALVERVMLATPASALTEEGMPLWMRETMRDRMNERMGAPEQSVPAPPSELEPDVMCSPVL